ncbi:MULTISPECIES: acyltransferase family protein [unclassified Pseudoalteromonas]|uniref:acyltransferase family protein n=1 Tax=unclassified Pseudoalteromonas TaxID=194690 RepID=UPI0013FDCFF9|nr:MULTISPECIES: acyltransferase family protein [unclassified Pseudoalteromonas]
MHFRKDINGLRAVAVIGVVLFHFNSSWMPGGFAGVDIFFVISGFLMTGIIFKGIEQKNFSIMRFYVARANRIIPALAVLCFVMLLFGWLYLPPLDYQLLGKHALSSISFLSNITYWTEAGYFDAASHEKWLLHTWSLSVEWQFYIIYPLVLVFIHKFTTIKLMNYSIVAATFLGFVFCVFASFNWPNAAYYLLPTRAWEMMIGGVAYLFPIVISNKKKILLERLGLALIVGSYFIVTKEDIWPGYAALFPVLGAFFVILAARDGSFVTGNVVFQKIGAWSYSIYLWHWPLVVGIYYYTLDDKYIYLGIALSLFLGFLSNKYIEQIRFKKDFGQIKAYLKCKPIYIALGISVLSLVIFGKTRYFYNMPDDIYNAVTVKPTTDNSDYTFDKLRELEGKTTFKDVKYKFLIIGDSQSGDFVNSLYETGLSNNVDVISRIVAARCQVFALDEEMLNRSFKVNDNISNGYISKKRCQKQISKIQADEALEKADVILVSMFWKDQSLPYVFKSIENIRSRNKSAKIYVVGGKSFNKSAQDIIYKSYYENTDISAAAYKEIANNDSAKIDFQKSEFIKYQKTLDFKFLNIIDFFCSGGECTILNSKNQPLYFDGTHTTQFGAKYLGVKVKNSNYFPKDFYQ